MRGKKGNGTEAEKLSVKSMDTRKKLLGQEDEETLSSMAMVGLVYGFEGRWKEAEELEVQVMENETPDGIFEIRKVRTMTPEPHQYL